MQRRRDDTQNGWIAAVLASEAKLKSANSHTTTTTTGEKEEEEENAGADAKMISLATGRARDDI